MLRSVRDGHRPATQPDAIQQQVNVVAGYHEIKDVHIVTLHHPSQPADVTPAIALVLKEESPLLAPVRHVVTTRCLNFALLSAHA